MAKRCKLGNTYCREARWLWADAEEAYERYERTRKKRHAKIWENLLDKYLAHRKSCINKRR